MTYIASLTVADMVAGLLFATLFLGALMLVRFSDFGSRPLLLKQMISRVGGKLDAAGDPLLGQKLASAARLCAGCRNHDQCRELLVECSGNDVPEYCPNRRWIRSLATSPA